jgi:hypothetical protein
MINFMRAKLVKWLRPAIKASRTGIRICWARATSSRRRSSEIGTRVLNTAASVGTGDENCLLGEALSAPTCKLLPGTVICSVPDHWRETYFDDKRPREFCSSRQIRSVLRTAVIKLSCRVTQRSSVANKIIGLSTSCCDVTYSYYAQLFFAASLYAALALCYNIRRE